MNQDYNPGGWQNRCTDISEIAGQTVSGIPLLKDVNTQPGYWDMLIADLAINRADGTVVQLFSSGMYPGLTVQGLNTQYDTAFNAVVEDVSPTIDPIVPLISSQAGVTHYFFSDHLGSAQMEFSTGGWPVSFSHFAPFGAELDSQVSSSHFKFTGKERDAESGLDYFGARYYASNMGRWMSPDPLETVTANKKVFTQVLMYPQDWNRYAYALNNPVAYKDETGNFTGRDHYAIEVAALTASGYSQGAAQRAARADAAMDTFHNMASGVPFLSMFVNGSENPQHGEQNGNQGVENAKSDANAYINSKLDAATASALSGDVGGALDAIGQASHTPQDVVRHQWEVSEDHPLGEAAATPAEKALAIQKTEKLLGKLCTSFATSA